MNLVVTICTIQYYMLGLRFRDGKIQVKVSSGKSEVLVEAEFVDNSTIMVKTPNYEAFGA